MPPLSGPIADRDPPHWFRFSLRSLILCGAMVAILAALTGRDHVRFVLAAAGLGLVLSALVLAWPTVISRFLCGFALVLLLVGGLNYYPLERTFRSYVHDGTPVAGWPRVFATGRPGWVPAPVAAPDFHVYDEPYWLAIGELYFDLGIGLVVALVGGAIFARPRWLSLSSRLPSQCRVAMWTIRCVALGGLAYMVLRYELLYQDPVRYFADGTRLDRAVLWLIAGLWMVPFVLPGHLWERRASELDEAGPRPNPFLTRVVTATLTAPAVAVVFIHASQQVCKWQGHYLNLQRTLVLIAVAIALLVAYARKR